MSTHRKYYVMIKELTNPEHVSLHIKILSVTLLRSLENLLVSSLNFLLEEE